MIHLLAVSWRYGGSLHLKRTSTFRKRRPDANCCSANEMPRWNVDNMITHACAAALIVDDNEVDVNDLRDDFKVDNKEYAHHSKFLSMDANTEQNASIFRRAGLQSDCAITNRPHQVEALQARSSEPLGSKTEASIEVPKSWRTNTQRQEVIYRNETEEQSKYLIARIVLPWRFLLSSLHHDRFGEFA
jgi:hypothetical protein